MCSGVKLEALFVVTLLSKPSYTFFFDSLIQTYLMYRQKEINRLFWLVCCISTWCRYYAKRTHC